VLAVDDVPVLGADVLRLSRDPQASWSMLNEMSEPDSLVV
jgi:hypothetical protein